jgi:hypothetical protein
MNDFSPETNQLLGLARGAGGLSSARRAHIKAGVFTQLVAAGLVSQVGLGAASAGVSSGAGATTALAGKAAWFSSSFAKVVSALALLSAAGGGAYVVSRAERAAAPPRVVAAGAVGTLAVAGAPASAVAAAPPAVESPPPALSAAAPSALADKLASSAARTASAAATPAASAGSSVVNAETLAEETRLLRDADQALRAGNSVRALGLLDEHATRFPRGVLAPERSAERLIARCQLGQVDAEAAQAYLKSHANSAFVARISDACNVVAR